MSRLTRTTQFQVRGLTVLGRVELRRFDAVTRAEAEQAARSAGIQVLAISARNRIKVSVSSGGRFDLALFAHELIALMGAGLSLIETLETLVERENQNENAHAPPVLADLVRRMQEGQAFSMALRSSPDTFPDLFVASVAASEQTGEIVPALQRWLRYHEQLGVIRQKIVSASIYPALLCIVGAAVALFLLCFLVPRFSRIYEGMEDRLPYASRWLMRWGMFASDHWMACVGALLAFMLALSVLLTRPASRELLGIALERSRWFGRRVRLMQLSRFYRSLGLLLGSGIPVTKALQMAQGLLPLRLQSAARSVLLEVTQGRSLSDSLQLAGLTTPVALRLLRAGERNGQMAEMLEQAAAFHDKEMAHWIDRFTRLFEPVLMLVIGLAIGGIVIMLYLPIFELAGSVQ